MNELLQIGAVVKIGRKRYIRTAYKHCYFESGPKRFRHVVYLLMPIPKGMKAADYGRKFDGGFLEAFVEEL